MTITELKYVVALAKEQHFGRAAQSVYVSQPTLSIGIKKIEADLGVKIFERLSNKAIPTQVGRRIVEAARATLMSADTIRSIANEAQGKLMGDIKLGAIYTMCPYLLPKMLPDLREHAPDIHLFVKEDYTGALIESLKNGELDVAIVSPPIVESNLFRLRTIAEEAFHVVVPNGHRFEQQDRIEIAELERERVFLIGNGNCFRDQVLQACPGCLPTNLKHNDAVEGGSLETIRMMVAGGLGISIFPEMALIDDSAVVTRPFSEPVPKRKIALAWRKSFLQETVIDILEETIRRCIARAVMTK